MRVYVLFNLRDGVDPATYEAWACTTDAPKVRGLASIAEFRVHALTGLLMSEGKPPYQYIEVIDVADPQVFGQEVATASMQEISKQFQLFADNPLFLTTREVAA